MVQIDERRRWQRRALSTTILFKTIEGAVRQPFRSGMMRDISDGGVSFDTEAPPTQGALIDMFFKEHENAADKRVRGRVVWTRSTETGMLVGVSYVG
jgi:hypothetical protein